MSDFRHKPTLREQLDAVRPDADDLADPDLRDAAAAVESSARWRDLFAAQQEFDRHLADVMQDVDLPDGAQQRLLDVLAEARASSQAEVPQESPETSLVRPDPDVTPASAPRMGRRRWAFMLTAAAGVAACIALGFMLWAGGPATLTLDEIREQIPLAADRRIDAGRLDPFDESFALSLPVGRWEQVAFDVPAGIDWTGDGRHDAALLPFVTSGRRPISGYLLILPASAVTDPPPPNRTLLSTAGVSYVPVDNTAWSAPTGDLIYICFTDPGQLRALQRLLYPQSA